METLRTHQERLERALPWFDVAIAFLFAVQAVSFLCLLALRRPFPQPEFVGPLIWTALRVGQRRARLVRVIWVVLFLGAVVVLSLALRLLLTFWPHFR